MAGSTCPELAFVSLRSGRLDRRSVQVGVVTMIPARARKPGASAEEPAVSAANTIASNRVFQRNRPEADNLLSGMQHGEADLVSYCASAPN
jgi:hypothetical protein